MSRRVVRVLGGFAAGVEVYSIDEAFLDLQGMNLLAPDLLAYGIRMRKTVKRDTGIPVCVGIAPTKTLAKLANRLARKQGANGVLLLETAAQWEEALAQAPVASIWGVGRRYAHKLQEMGTVTGAGLAAHLVTVILGTDKYAPTAGPKTHTAAVSLPVGTNDSSALTQAALQGLHRLRRPGVACHRAGVLLSGLEPAGQTQLGLFAAPIAAQPAADGNPGRAQRPVWLAAGAAGGGGGCQKLSRPAQNARLGRPGRPLLAPVHYRLG